MQMSLLKDHPRLRGKDLSINYFTNCLVGSPPLTRERHKKIQLKTDVDRITPAYAGKTGRDLDNETLEQDHPRLRGKDEACPHRTFQ